MKEVIGNPTRPLPVMDGSSEDCVGSSLRKAMMCKAEGPPQTKLPVANSHSQVTIPTALEGSMSSHDGDWSVADGSS